MVYRSIKFHNKMSAPAIWAIAFILQLFAVQLSDSHAQATTTLNLPARSNGALPGIAVIDAIENMPPARVQTRLQKEILSGNIPSHLRTFVPVRWTEPTSGTQPAHDITIWVAPDYLGTGEDNNFMRVPLTPQTAQHIADVSGCLLPTPKMVDKIYQNAPQKLAPQPLSPDLYKISSPAAWKASNYLLYALTLPPKGFVAGHRKDLVISRRLQEDHTTPRGAIYGWHKPNGSPIQPLSLVHNSKYVDYSHGVRLIDDTIQIDGARIPLERILLDPKLAYTISYEGPLTSASIRYDTEP